MKIQPLTFYVSSTGGGPQKYVRRQVVCFYFLLASICCVLCSVTSLAWSGVDGSELPNYIQLACDFVFTYVNSEGTMMKQVGCNVARLWLELRSVFVYGLHQVTTYFRLYELQIIKFKVATYSVSIQLYTYINLFTYATINFVLPPPHLLWSLICFLFHQSFLTDSIIGVSSQWNVVFCWLMRTCVCIIYVLFSF